MLYGIIGGVVALVIILVVVLVLKSRKDAAGEAAAAPEESYEDVGVTLVERTEPEPELTLVDETPPVYAPPPEPVRAPEPIIATEPEPQAPVEMSFDDDISADSSADEAVEISLEIDAPAEMAFDAEPGVGVEDMLAITADADAVEVSLEHGDDVEEVALDAGPAPEKADSSEKKKEGEEGFATEVDSELDALFGD